MHRARFLVAAAATGSCRSFAIIAPGRHRLNRQWPPAAAGAQSAHAVLDLYGVVLQLAGRGAKPVSLYSAAMCQAHVAAQSVSYYIEAHRLSRSMQMVELVASSASTRPRRRDDATAQV